MRRFRPGGLARRIPGLATLAGTLSPYCGQRHLKLRTVVSGPLLSPRHPLEPGFSA